MPLETATSIQTLNPSYPIDGDQEGQGAAHIRMVKQVLQTAFPSLGGPVTATAAQLAASASLLPNGPTGGLQAPLVASADPAQGSFLQMPGAAGYSGWKVTTNGGSLILQNYLGATATNRFILRQDGQLQVIGGNLFVQGGGQVYEGATLLSFIGEVRMFHGSAAQIPGGWQVCDGTNGTPDLRDRFVVGAGNQYAVDNAGGLASVALAGGEMPTHSHAVNDPSHVHGVYDPGHNHGIIDPGHAHTVTTGQAAVAGGPNAVPVPGGAALQATSTVGTGVGLYPASSNISIYGASTGITLQNSGSGVAHENRPPYYALYYIMRVG